MRKSRLKGGVHRALVVAGAVLGVALLCAPVASADGPVEVRTRLNGFCLAVFTVSMGVIYPCNGQKYQQWVFNPAGQIETAAEYVFLRGTCLTLTGPQDGAYVDMTPCRSIPNQLWTRQPNGQITNALGPCLAVGRGGSTTPKTPVIGFHCTANTPGQEWDIAP